MRCQSLYHRPVLLLMGRRAGEDWCSTQTNTLFLCYPWTGEAGNRCQAFERPAGTWPRRSRSDTVALETRQLRTEPSWPRGNRAGYCITMCVGEVTENASLMTTPEGWVTISERLCQPVPYFCQSTVKLSQTALMFPLLVWKGNHFFFYIQVQLNRIKIN